MAEDRREEWVQLVRDHGEEYWLAEMKKAEKALIIYGVVLVVAVLIRVLWPFGAEYILVPMILPLLMMAGVTIYMGFCQSNLLPFMHAKQVTHWIMVGFLAMCGCGGLLWLALFASSNKRAKTNLERAIETSKAPPTPGISPYPRA